MPVAVLITTGKIASRNTTAILDGASIPNMKMNSGASATVGVAYTADTHGSTKSLTASLLAMAIPSRMPRTAAIAKPMKNSLRLTRTCRCSSPVADSCRNLPQMSEIGARINGQRPLRPAISQTRPTITSDRRPRTVEMCARYQRRTDDSRRSRSSSSPIAISAIGVLCIPSLSHVQCFGYQAAVDVLHGVSGHVLGAHFLQVVDELLDQFFVDAQVLRD